MPSPPSLLYDCTRLIHAPEYSALVTPSAGFPHKTIITIQLPDIRYQRLDYRRGRAIPSLPSLSSIKPLSSSTPGLYDSCAVNTRFLYQSSILLFWTSRAVLHATGTFAKLPYMHAKSFAPHLKFSGPDSYARSDIHVPPSRLRLLSPHLR
jgi:hypothetical protein